MTAIEKLKEKGFEVYINNENNHMYHCFHIKDKDDCTVISITISKYENEDVKIEFESPNGFDEMMEGPGSVTLDVFILIYEYMCEIGLIKSE